MKKIIISIIFISIFLSIFAESEVKKIGISAGTCSLLGTIFLSMEGLKDMGNYEFRVKNPKSKRWDRQFSVNIEPIEVDKSNEAKNSQRSIGFLLNVLVGFSLNYYNSDESKYYSGLHGGLMLGNAIFPSLDITLLGIEFKKTNIYMELNAGTKAIASVGMNF